MDCAFWLADDKGSCTSSGLHTSAQTIASYGNYLKGYVVCHIPCNGDYGSGATNACTDSSRRACVSGVCELTSCPSGTVTACQTGTGIVATQAMTLTNGTKCYTCSCASGRTGYKTKNGTWKNSLWKTSDGPAALKYCCDKTDPIPDSESPGTCVYCGGNAWSCDPNKVNADCPSGSFCFSSGDSNGWHCHGLSHTGKIWRNEYYVQVGNSKICNFPSARKAVAKNLCSALGLSGCCTSYEYNWSDGTCYKANSSNTCVAKTDTTCDSQKSLANVHGTSGSFGICTTGDSAKGGAICCH